jgi:hypothetical protein
VHPCAFDDIGGERSLRGCVFDDRAHDDEHQEQRACTAAAALVNQFTCSSRGPLLGSEIASELLWSLCAILGLNQFPVLSALPGCFASRCPARLPRRMRRQRLVCRRLATARTAARP